MAKIEAPEAIEFEKKEVKKQKEEEAEKSTEKEGQTKRAKEKAGRIGRNDATPKDTIIPKGKEDILREKVQKVGILCIIGRDKAPGSGLSKLFAQSNDVEQAMAGMAGAKMVVGHGAGGLTTSGSGPGGGGTGYGHIYGAGNLDTGGRGTHGHGRGPKLSERGEHEVSVGLGTGGGDTDGSLSKEQINKVVRAHLAGVKYCYEKELQHKTSLVGRRRHLLGDPARRHGQQGQRQAEHDERRRRRGVHRPPGQAVAVPQGPRSDDRRPLSLHLQRRVVMKGYRAVRIRSRSVDPLGARLPGHEHADLLPLAGDAAPGGDGGRRHEQPAAGRERDDAASSATRPMPSRRRSTCRRPRSGSTSPGSSATHVHIELTYQVTNTDTKDGTWSIGIDGANEYTKYDENIVAMTLGMGNNDPPSTSRSSR